MSRPAVPLRLFVAVYPPPAVVVALQEQRRARVERGVREVAPEQVHMTLQFIGPTPPHRLDPTVEHVKAACQPVGAFSLQPERLLTLPLRGRPRLVAAETNAPPSLLELHRRLAGRLARAPRHDAADRFLPHLTLCRYRPGEQAPRVDAPVECEPFAVDRVLLMRSILKPTGAEHLELHAFPLRA